VASGGHRDNQVPVQNGGFARAKTQIALHDRPRLAQFRGCHGGGSTPQRERRRPPRPRSHRRPLPASTAASSAPPIAALAGVAGHEAGLASGLLNTTQQLGAAIGVAVASTIAATHATTLLHQGAPPAAALTSGFQWAFWACGAIGLAGVPVTYLLVRRHELATAVASASAKPQPASAKA